MRKPRIPPMLSDLIVAALIACDGAAFDSRDRCPSCGNALSGYDTKTRRFAVIMDENQERTIRVRVKRFSCSTCRQILNADEPFYPGTRTGSPVIDLCVTLGRVMPPGRVSAILAAMGIIVDRWSVRNYLRQGFSAIPSMQMFGMELPVSVVMLSTTAAGLRKGSRFEAADILAACRFPSQQARPPGPSREP
jgi:hypothetical protein